mmetsp:Transcript_433/g.1126  ORF Transcript_433/g.1126 Transcript_433/m.1126 type:complete len:119 (-) Transcript_433:436-792(-)
MALSDAEESAMLVSQSSEAVAAVVGDIGAGAWLEQMAITPFGSCAKSFGANWSGMEATAFSDGEFEAKSDARAISSALQLVEGVELHADSADAIEMSAAEELHSVPLAVADASHRSFG